jgi:hypothetical protein
VRAALDIITQIVVIVSLIWFIQWIAYRERREYKEYRAWKKKHAGQSPVAIPRPETPKIAPPPVDDPDVIILDKYRRAK